MKLLSKKYFDLSLRCFVILEPDVGASLPVSLTRTSYTNDGCATCRCARTKYEDIHVCLVWSCWCYVFSASALGRYQSYIDAVPLIKSAYMHIFAASEDYPFYHCGVTKHWPPSPLHEICMLRPQKGIKCIPIEKICQYGPRLLRWAMWPMGLLFISRYLKIHILLLSSFLSFSYPQWPHNWNHWRFRGHTCFNGQSVRTDINLRTIMHHLTAPV
jgi:hypothetical protein